MTKLHTMVRRENADMQANCDLKRLEDLVPNVAEVVSDVRHKKFDQIIALLGQVGIQTPDQLTEEARRLTGKKIHELMRFGTLWKKEETAQKNKRMIEEKKYGLTATMPALGRNQRRNSLSSSVQIVHPDEAAKKREEKRKKKKERKDKGKR